MTLTCLGGSPHPGSTASLLGLVVARRGIKFQRHPGHRRPSYAPCGTRPGCAPRWIGHFVVRRNIARLPYISLHSATLHVNRSRSTRMRAHEVQCAHTETPTQRGSGTLELPENPPTGSSRCPSGCKIAGADIGIRSGSAVHGVGVQGLKAQGATSETWGL